MPLKTVTAVTATLKNNSPAYAERLTAHLPIVSRTLISLDPSLLCFMLQRAQSLHAFHALFSLCHASSHVVLTIRTPCVSYPHTMCSC